jgi:hypothetical protein
MDDYDDDNDNDFRFAAPNYADMDPFADEIDAVEDGFEQPIQDHDESEFEDVEESVSFTFVGRTGQGADLLEKMNALDLENEEVNYDNEDDSGEPELFTTRKSKAEDEEVSPVIAAARATTSASRAITAAPKPKIIRSGQDEGTLVSIS